MQIKQISILMSNIFIKGSLKITLIQQINATFEKRVGSINPLFIGN